MTDLYSYKDVALIFGLQEARLRYWAQTGFVGPSARQGGRSFFRFRDLIAVRVAKDLLDSGMSLQRVRRNLEALRTLLPETDQPLASGRVISDGDKIVVIDDDGAFVPDSGQVLMDFAVSALSSQIADVLHLPSSAAAGSDDDAATSDSAAANDAGEVGPSAFASFEAGCAAEVGGDLAEAEARYRRALELDPQLAAAHTNLGNVLYARGAIVEARARYEVALELEPDQAEARYNLGNVLEELGEVELAIAELRQVCTRCPDFADAHFNLGLALANVGGTAQARLHLERYIALDPNSGWSDKAREYLAQL